MNNLSTKIIEFNEASNGANIEINRLILEVIHEAGFDENNAAQIRDYNDINRLTRFNLRNEIYHAPDVRERARTFDARMGAETLVWVTVDDV